MDTFQRLIDECFAADAAVRYVAVYRHGGLRLAERPGIENASASETDRFEELLVNPTLLTLVRQRGEIDCGGLDWVLIRYGNFFTFLRPVPDGHVNVGLPLDADLTALCPKVQAVIDRWAAGDDQ